LQQRLLDNEKQSSAARELLQQSLADSESKCAELANQLQETQDKVGQETMDQMADVDIDGNEDLEATQALLQQAEGKNLKPGPILAVFFFTSFLQFAIVFRIRQSNFT